METNTHKQTKVQLSADVDLRLREEFKLGVLKFENNPLHRKLRSDGQVLDKLKFVPRMLFFVMGFKDLMQLVRYENATTKEEQSVNIHSDEDSNHWEWYLRDLSYINGWFKNTDSHDLISEIWDEKSLDVRRAIYLFSSYMHTFQDPIARMLMVEVLEMTFDKFKEAIHPVLKESDLYDQLEYFGKKHQETEENHTTGISDDEISELINELPAEHKEDMIVAVNQLFDQMYKMAASWAEA